MSTPAASAQPTPPTDPPSKRRRIGLQVSVEAGADGAPPVYQVFSDGTYLPASDSHFERTSAAASAFVYRALTAPRPGPASASAETNATDSYEPTAEWAKKAFVAVDGSIYELTQFLAAIEALRAEAPLLELKRTVPKAARRSNDVVEREGFGMLRTKKRLVNCTADFLVDRVKALENWIEKDNAFCDAVLTMRKRCNGVRRLSNGTPLIDVGDGDYAAVHRPLDSSSSSTLDQESHPIPSALPSEPEKKDPVVRVQFPAATYLKFGVSNLDNDHLAVAAPVALEDDRNMDHHSLPTVVRRVRLSRVSAFRRRTFDQIAKEAAALPLLTARTTTTIAVGTGPRDFLRLEKTHAYNSAPSLDANTDANVPAVDNPIELQTASLLQMISTRACLAQLLTVGPQLPVNVLDCLLDVTSSRSVLQATEKVLDNAVKMLRVRLEWTRSTSRVEEARVRVFSTSADGDGPARALATVEPLSKVNNGGNDGHNGHVRITPAFGVIIAAPDDPGARGRAVTPHSHSSSSGATSSPLGLDDVPRSYVCPVGSEILSVLTLLLCIRLLDALEVAAWAGEEELLDVDRQCFTVIVSAPNNGHTLKAKVWPRGPGVGGEVPGSTAWLNGRKIRNFPANGPGRLAAWKQLLRRLVAGDVESGDEVDGEEEDEGESKSKDANAMQVLTPKHEQAVPFNVANSTGSGVSRLPPQGGSEGQDQLPF